ncbi:asparagine synthase (glutamine-hydrolyzing) [Aeromicrobium panaciterrae]|uniref:Asparagine synthase (Glutamine-hydrolyzing) n=1 Tax=Aeromicrobium panaciterrae TaxID=363861 RepID=A0ABU1UQD2_9ACTN|nr:TylF/MycF/NovP-related O-methyltransferase [Aeromicrobium panaciterrae]MDR7087386.1 asparagine synthase (glutamine-hydrolyzing) [Aeromicrobium panaciterrae]
MNRIRSAVIRRLGGTVPKPAKARTAGTPDQPKKEPKVLRLLRARYERLQADYFGVLRILAGDTELSPEVGRVLLHVVSNRLTMIRVPELVEMCAVVTDLQARGIKGSFLETGTANGGSAILLTALKEPDRELAVYDVFGQIPPPSSEDGKDVHKRYETIVSGEAVGPGGSDYYGYEDDLLGKVSAAFSAAGYPVDDNRVSLVQGLFEDTLHPDGPIAFAHLDGDWYESTIVSLERVVPHLSVGGVLAIDDYRSWSGCAKAVDEFFAERTDFERIDDAARLRFVRLSQD